MKKFRMMLPVLAVVFAVVGAVAGSFLPPITQGFYKNTPVSCTQTAQALDQANCELELPSNRPVCTINIVGHPQAYANNGCSQILRYVPQ